MADNFPKGTIIKFVGYSGDAGTDAPLKAGDIVQVDSYTEEDGYRVTAPFLEVAEMLFPEEVGAATAEEVAASWAGQTENAPVEIDGEVEGAAPVENTEVAEAQPQGAAAEVQAEAPAEAAPAAKPAKPAKGQSKKKQAVAEAVAKRPDLTSDDPVVARNTALTLSAPGSSVIRAADLDQMDGDQILNVAQRLAENDAQNDYQLGAVLGKIYAGGLFKRVGYDGKRAFHDYLKAELGMNYRKAMYLIGNFEKLTALGVTEEHLAGVGWSKIKEILGGADAENIHERLEYAATHTRAEVQQWVKTEVVDAQETQETMVRKTFTFKVVGDAGPNIEATLKLAEPLCGADSPSAAFEYIMADWRQNQEGFEMIPLEEAVAMLETKYGVKLQVAGQEATEQATVAA